MIFLNNKVYDVLKVIALIVLPLSELIASIANIWGLQYGSQIVATLVAIDAFMGTIIKIASDSYSHVGANTIDIDIDNTDTNTEGE